MVGTLYMIPTPLSKEDINWVIPDAVQQRVADISHYVVEHPKTARQFLKQVGCKLPLQQINMQVLDEHTQATDLLFLLQPLLAGLDVGLVSEAGCPAVADPGAELVRLAHQKNIQVVPLVGPSSIMLALMASGLNGQCFAFNGYLPIDKAERKKEIKRLERLSFEHNQSQIFIETPYRNNKMIEDLSHILENNTDVCVACDITLPTEFIKTQTANDWKKNIVDFHKRPTIFIIHKS